jgi:hypothetical protein
VFAQLEVRIQHSPSPSRPETPVPAAALVWPPCPRQGRDPIDPAGYGRLAPRNRDYQKGEPGAPCQAWGAGLGGKLRAARGSAKTV